MPWVISKKHWRVKMNGKNKEKFQEILGYSFRDEAFLILALTHSSFANENKLGRNENNERLEFLGDAVLDMVVSEYMYCFFPEMPEGELTKLRAGVVCEGSLAKLARSVSLGQFIMLGKGEESTGGRDRDSILADAFEAVIGAVCLDGGMEAVKSYIMGFMENEIAMTQNSFRTMDCKTHLQEMIQKFSKVPISYKIIREDGPDHDKIFFAQVHHGDVVLGSGSGKSKKEAEQAAANDALEHGKIE